MIRGGCAGLPSSTARPKTLPSPALSSSSERGVCSPTASSFGRGNVEGCTSILMDDSGHPTTSRNDGAPLNSDTFELNHEGRQSNVDTPPPGSADIAGANANDVFSFAGVVAQKNVPGSNASTIRIHSLWQSLPRIIISSKSHFGNFFQAMLSKPSGVVHSETSTASPWPMPLPYRFAKGTYHGDDNEHAFRKLINLQVGILNFFCLGEPLLPPRHICCGNPLNDLQKDVIRRLRRLCEAWKDLPPIEAKEMGRTAAKQERQEETLSKLAKFATPKVVEMKKYSRAVRPISRARPDRDVGQKIGRSRSDDTQGAQNIVASRIKMEGKPSFDPVPFLDDSSANLYCNPMACNIDPDSVAPRPPRVRIHANFDEKISLLKVLEETGRLGFRSIREITPGFGNGLFCVPKNIDIDRLILDGRPANLLQIPPNRFIMTMASATTLLGLHLAEDEKLLMSGDDLSNFFYTFKVNYDRGTRNFLDWKIPVKVAKQFSSFPCQLLDEDFVVACLTSLAMGDSAACEYAQTAHVALGLQSNAFSQHHLVTMHGRIPRSPFLAGIIIDDFVLLEKVAMDASSSLLSGERRQRMHNMYSSVGLDAHPTKGFSDSESCSFWGADVDGRKGLIRGNVTRAASLVWVTSRIATMGISTIGLLEVIAGGFVALFGFRRRLMSLLDMVYLMQGGRDRQDVIRLPESAVDELWSLVILCPLAVTDIRAGFSNWIFMVDSSNWGEAVVRAPVSESTSQEMHRHGLNKSCWTRLLSPFKAYLRGKGTLDVCDELPPGESSLTEHPLWEVAARGLDYDLLWKCRARSIGRHINLGEMKAYLKAESLGGRCGDVRLPIGGDSQVVLGAIAKGRSASPGLNRMMRHSLPDILGLGIYSSGGYVRSEHNPSDDPTRGVPLRSPSIDLPSWWLSLASGDYSAFDAMLADLDLHPDQLCGYPPLNELYLKDEGILASGLKSSKNNMHRRVRHRLRLRKTLKDSGIEESVGKDHESVWSKEVADLLSHFGKDQILVGEGHNWPPTQAGFIDLFSGKKGFAKSALHYGAPWVLVVDIEDGPQCDLLCNETRRAIEGCFDLNAVVHLSAAPICSSLSRAITPAVRSKEKPRGFDTVSPEMKRKIAEGNSHSQWLAKLIKICLAKGIKYWVENPDGSFLWLQPEWMSMRRSVRESFFRVDFCTFGTPWRKRTRFLTNGRLSHVKRLCNRQHQHLVLRGRSKKHQACWTKVAEPYPRRLCNLLGHAACCDLGLYKGPNSLSCRHDHRRIGEAKNPGPQRRRSGRHAVSELDGVELVRPETVALGKLHWEKFFDWVRVLVGDEVAVSLWKVPSLMGSMMAAYGRHWYGSGGPLYCFRHLIVYAQRLYPLLKGNLQEAWTVVAKWEELEPVEHRRPIPLSLVNAMVTLALSWRWTRVACIILIGFHACTRPGEVLRARRNCLILPEDVDSPPGSACFLKILKPKPGRRGLGRTQHAKVRDSVVSVFLSRIFLHVEPSEFLYPGTAGSFRTRWNMLLSKLLVPPSTMLTPGCLRAGGTVELYIRGMPIMDILWSLRLRNIETLQHYLQEISTQITMIDLPQDARKLILSFSQLYAYSISSYGL